MKNYSEPLETLQEIRLLMERSSRFISLNGLSGVFAGLFALIGAAAAFLFMSNHQIQLLDNGYETALSTADKIPFYVFFLTDASLVLLASLAISIFLTIRKARQQGLTFWDNTTKRVLINMLIPLVVGGLFCVILLFHGHVGFIASSTLIFYGLALINTSKYTFNEIRYLGITETILGLMAALWVGYGLLFWTLGFGVAHITYGIIMYFKHER